MQIPPPRGYFAMYCNQRTYSDLDACIANKGLTPIFRLRFELWRVTSRQDNQIHRGRIFVPGDLLSRIASATARDDIYRPEFCEDIPGSKAEHRVRPDPPIQMG